MAAGLRQILPDDFASSSKASFIATTLRSRPHCDALPGCRRSRQDGICDLYRRHAESVRVVGMLASECRKAGAKRTAGRSLLSLVPRSPAIVAPPISDYDTQLVRFHGQTQPPGLPARCRSGISRDLVRGQFFVERGNFNLIDALLPNHRTAKATWSTEVPYITASHLRYAGHRRTSTAPTRLAPARRSERLAIDQGVVLGDDDFLENRHIEGYRLSP